MPILHISRRHLAFALVDADRRVALITLTDAGKKLSGTIPDPIEKRLINELIDLDKDHVQFISMALNQILHLIDVKDVEETYWEPNYESIPTVPDSSREQRIENEG